MAMPALDTHKAVKTLRSAGFDDAQAEAVVEQISDAINQNVATKADIEKLSNNVAVDIEKLSNNVAADIEKLSNDVAADIEKLSTKLDNVADNMELRLERELEKQANRYLRYVFVAVAAVAGLTKALDVLIV